MPLPEDLRQEYLQVMGIASYFPRLKLPGAPDSVQVQWPQSWQLATLTAQPDSNAGKMLEEPEIKQAPNNGTTTSAPPVRPAHVLTTGKKLEPSATETEPTGNTGVKPRQEEYRLQLACIRVNESLAILNAMPHIGPRALPVRHLNLLQNLLKVSGISHENLLVEEKPFHWPMVQGQQMDNSKYAAASALMAYLEQKLTDWQFSTLLVMGEQTITEVFAAEKEEEGEGEEEKEEEEEGEQGKDTREGEKPTVIDIDSQAWQTLYTRSLDELLQRPALKKELWKVFRKLNT